MRKTKANRWRWLIIEARRPLFSKDLHFQLLVVVEEIPSKSRTKRKEKYSELFWERRRRFYILGFGVSAEVVKWITNNFMTNKSGQLLKMEFFVSGGRFSQSCCAVGRPLLPFPPLIFPSTHKYISETPVNEGEDQPAIAWGMTMAQVGTRVPQLKYTISLMHKF